MERFVALVFVVVLVGAGCGGDGEETGMAAQSGTGVPDVSLGTLDGLPRMDDSRELTEATQSDGGISRSFGVTMTTPLEVVRFYRTELPRMGWEQISTADGLEGGALRGMWWRGDVLLEVNAGFEPAIDAEVTTDEPAVRYSLLLRPLSADAAG